MKTTLIAAVAKNGVIGNKGTIPWHLPEDFKHFSATTMGHAVIMGSKTYESLPEKFRPLPHRVNVVVTSKAAPNCPYIPGWPHNVLVVGSLEAAEYHLTCGTTPIVHPDSHAFIIGGASIYEQAIKTADRLIISHVDMKPKGDTYFPKIGKEWIEVSRDPRKGFDIVTYEKKKND